ncbi:hypothetical protein H7827_13295 [Streptomyces sp. JH002]|uniref:hypothetical protein n=1 Tax=Streptomyces sp. JH002 TaxID=2763259 RepID=UPI003D80491E
MSKVPYAAYLRVYEPLGAFPEPERAHWARYAERGDIPGPQEELRRSIRELIAVPGRVVPPKESADAFVAVVDGVVCVCPWRTRLRSWEALGEVGHWLMPQSVLDAALPPQARERAVEEYGRWRERNPDARPWIRSALWHVPVRWFALFADEEREFTAAEPAGEGLGEGRPAALRYRTPMVRARQRVARGLRTVRDAARQAAAEAPSEVGAREEKEEELGAPPGQGLGDGPLAAALTDVGRWLEEFHPRSLVELDYGGLVYTITEEQLAADRSAAEVAAGLSALAEGDLERAGRLYEELTERWMTVRERQFAN